MKIIPAYIKQHKKGIAAFFLFCVIFAVSFILYRLPAEAVAYPALLCCLLGFLFLAHDFCTVKHRHEVLCEMQKLTSQMISDMPETAGIETEDYKALVRNLQNEVADVIGSSSARYQNLIEYYTVWVHQIKTPITSMRLSLEKEDSVLFRKLSSDLFQIEQYVDMVMAFLRLDSDDSDYVFKEHDIDEIIRQSVTRFAPEFIARKISLEYSPVNIKAVTDDKWFSFVLEQLLSNALKYTREGSIKIYSKGARTLCIEDSGIGIAADDLPRVFEKGYTGYNGRQDKRASGIGLYLCKRICDRLGAKISISSEVDRGTVVSIGLEQYEIGKE